MIDYRWQEECSEYMTLTKEHKHDLVKPSHRMFNFFKPPSHCPQCQNYLRWWHMIPIASYPLLHGKCANCGVSIPGRYFTVEITTLILGLLVANEFGLSLSLFAALIFTFILIAAAFIDMEQQILPDDLTIPLLWIGLFFSCIGLFTNSVDSILGAIFGYMFFWIIQNLAKLFTTKEIIGQGDFKLLAAVGAWLGWQSLLFVILTSSILALIVSGVLILIKHINRRAAIPYGTFISIAAWVYLVMGVDLSTFYYSLFG
jgi:leader peptidase (prepilin peptidase)/N-methyltransferase